MTTEQLQEQFKGLMTVDPPKSEIEKLFNKAIESGALDYVDEEEDSYRTAKIIYHAILCAMAKQWKPLISANRSRSEKLKLYL
jgi:transcriptional/translational regulatory protein YebC/TACO1